MGKTSREKGKRGEREIAGILTAHGYNCRRGVQYHGGPESPDVVGLPGIHIEVKRVERLNIENAVDQAINDSDGSGDLAAVFHRKNKRGWSVTMPLDDWMVLYDIAQEYVRETDPNAERSLPDIQRLLRS